MPLVRFIPKSTCPHHNIHPKWQGREGIWAVCQMPISYLENCVALLRRTIDEAYPFTPGKRSPLELPEIKHAEDQLRLLEAELFRRQA